MMFNTPEFIALLLMTFVLYYLLPKARVWLLTIANIAFYGVVGPGYLLLYAVISFLTYACALRIRETSGGERKLLLGFTMLVNLGNLFFFKYTGFALTSLEKLLHLHLVNHDSKWLALALPLGISFYTFELISYAVDVYKGRFEPEKSLLRFWIFIMFFAHMIAGPIMRGNEFLPQIERLKRFRFEWSNMRMGMLFLTVGMIKKVWISDYLAPYVDSFFKNPYALTGVEGWTAAVLYAFQIYCDFSGYSDMAVGVGYLFGLELAINFRTPYVSANASEFWRRWHITLSTWIRDYIYIPLGGSRNGVVRQYANLFIAMTLSGVWHGAAWTFVVWGMYYGGLQIAQRLYAEVLNRLGIGGVRTLKVYRVLVVAVFFAITCIGWVLFRVQGLQPALSLIKRMLTIHSFAIPEPLRVFWWIALGLYVLHVLEFLLMNNLERISAWWHRWIPSPLRAAVYTSIVLLLVVFLKLKQSSFIYFQF